MPDLGALDGVALGDLLDTGTVPLARQGVTPVFAVADRATAAGRWSGGPVVFVERDPAWLLEVQRRDRRPLLALAALAGRRNTDGVASGLVDWILHEALREQASDVHVEPRAEMISLRLRVDGILREHLTMPKAVGGAVVNRCKVLAGVAVTDRLHHLDGQFRVTVDGHDLSIRVATTPTQHGEKVALRLHDASARPFSLDDIGVSAVVRDSLAALTAHAAGLVLCVGPPGAGKTTSLYAMAGHLADQTRNVITLEEPVEGTLAWANQIPLSGFARLPVEFALPSVLRQDPDVVLIGEIRDAATARLAIHLALTGQVVLSSFHATDTLSALERLADIGLPRPLIARALTAVVSQRLVRRLCPDCAQPHTPNTVELDVFHTLQVAAPATVNVPGGCPRCEFSGYRGRLGVFDVRALTEPVRDAFADDDRRLLATMLSSRLPAEAGALIAGGVTSFAELTRVFGPAHTL